MRRETGRVRRASDAIVGPLVATTGPNVACCRCSGALSLHEGRPQITPDGRVDVWCAPCWALRHTSASGAASAPRADASVAISPSGARRPRRRWAAIAAAAAVGIGAIAATGWRAPLAGTWRGRIDARVAPPAPSPELAVALAPMVPDSEVPSFDPDRGMPEVEAGGRPRADGAVSGTAVPLRDGEPLDERYPTLRDWVHPVTATRQLVPDKATRWFGATRQGVEREECASGHCGVDLGGPRGQPVVAVAWGIVEHVERSWMGRDGRSGRYVRIAHPDGVFTAYMHLDDIAEGIDVGDEVQPGQMVGTLGKSGVVNAGEHLHFSLEVPGARRSEYVDPAPFLRRAVVVPVPDRRRARKPQW
jgi:murein DD-endopeptidase MepM/ murein hydrolase activator NlpD